VILDNVAQYFPRAAAVGIALRDHGTGALQPVACRGMLLEDWKRGFFTGDSFVNATTDRPIVIADLRSDPQQQPAQREFIEKYGHVSLLTVPIQIEDRNLGSIGFATIVNYQFSNHEIEFLTTLAGQAAVAIQNAALYEQTRKQAAELAEQERVQRILKELSQDITTMSVDTLLEKLTGRIREVFKVEMSDVRILVGTEWSHVTVASEDGFQYLPKGGELRVGATDWVIKNRKPIAIVDYLEQKEFTRGRVANMFAVRGFLAAPLLSKSGEVLGVIRALSKQPRTFSTQEIDLFQQLANGAAIAIENERLYANLQKSDKAKSEFLGVMSHELRTPLNVIMGYTNLIKDELAGDTNAPHRQSLQIIEHHANNLLAIINTIMDATRIESGEVTVDKQEVYLADLFEQLKTVCSLPKEKDIALLWNLPQGLPNFMTDYEKLRRILRNLIDNAIKFTDAGTVTISARLVDAGDAQDVSRISNLVSRPENRDTNDEIRDTPNEIRAIEFSVRDTGVGIAEQVIPSIFDMFKQGDSSTTRAYEGAGLGLYIAKKYSDLLGATLTVESTAGQGSTFTLTIPAAA